MTLDPSFPLVPALLGGATIGIAATLLLWLNGQIAGISGMVNGVLDRRPGSLWRWCFLLGLLCGAALWMYASTAPASVPDSSGIRWIRMVAGGLLVGFGTRLGCGCTSGHGVCGLGRLSLRSFIATLCYLGAGMLVVLILRLMNGDLL